VNYDSTKKDSSHDGTIIRKAAAPDLKKRKNVVYIRVRPEGIRRRDRNVQRLGGKEKNNA
jgi:hypothetical protein